MIGGIYVCTHLNSREILDFLRHNSRDVVLLIKSCMNKCSVVKFVFSTAFEKRFPVLISFRLIKLPIKFALLCLPYFVSLTAKRRFCFLLFVCVCVFVLKKFNTITINVSRRNTFCLHVQTIKHTHPNLSS